MSLRRQPQQQRSQERLDRILNAAAEVFWDVGYEAATTHAIATRAKTAVGAIYRFFPDKLAIFHALEKQHYDALAHLHQELLFTKPLDRPLRVLVRDIVETFAEYFQNPAPRVVYLQFFVNPSMFAYFDADYNAYLDCSLAGIFRRRNPQLDVAKSELVAQVFNQSYRALLLDAIRNYSSQFQIMNDEIQVLLFQYLDLYIGDRFCCVDVGSPFFSGKTFEHWAREHQLTSRQQIAMKYAIQHQGLTIQLFETLCPQVSRRSLQRDLKALIGKQLLIAEGQTNQLYYRPTKLATSSDADHSIRKAEVPSDNLEATQPSLSS